MTPLNSYFSSDNGVLRTDDQVLAFPGLVLSEFDRGLGRHLTAKKSTQDFVVYGPVTVQLWGQRFIAGIRFFRDVVHGVTLTLEQSRVAALGYDATEKDRREKNADNDALEKIGVRAFIDITRRRRVRIPLGRSSFESGFEVDMVRDRSSL